MILLVVGIVMMSFASYAWAYSEHGGDGLYYAKKQAKQESNLRILDGDDDGSSGYMKYIMMI